MPRKSIRAWKAFRRDNRGRLRFMFHPHGETSVVPLGTWLETKARWVHNPGKKIKGTAYRAGFHCFLRRADADRFEKLTKGKYLIRPVLVSGVWPKPRSRVGSWLTRRLFVPKEGEANL